MQGGVLSSSALLLGGLAGAVRFLPTFVKASADAIINPDVATGSATVGEVTGYTALRQMQQIMMADRAGRSILKKRPQVTDDTLVFAESQPEGTFGRRYAAFMRHNNFLPSGRPPVTCISDPALAYVMLRQRQIHDFVHAYLGCGRTVEEELAVKLFEWYHTGLPVGVLAVLGGMPHLSVKQCLNMRKYNNWAKANAPCQLHGERFVPCIMNVPWEWYLDKPYEQLVEDLGIVPLDVYLEQEKGM
uniref:Ubiquinone biosynthesis protein COQ4 homolog, mitochondrial n=1 Tax=Trypanosoma congolense (strain IL3000) TaxID=1068625 RepID=G0V2L3_TRYCI|nr:unnamed protein product [Trypanosoma congolense IL3000]